MSQDCNITNCRYWAREAEASITLVLDCVKGDNIAETYCEIALGWIRMLAEDLEKRKPPKGSHEAKERKEGG